MAASPVFTSLAELQNLISPSRAIDLFDDDNNNVITDTEPAVKAALDAANSAVTSLIYKKGFELSQILVLSADEMLRRCATAIFAQYGGERKTEFLDQNGHGRYEAIGARARADLQAVASGELRSRLEQDAGPNPLVQSATNVPKPVFFFNPDPRYPGRPTPGGF